MALDDVAAGGAPVIASLPMGGGAVRGPGAGKLCVKWGLGNELRVTRARGPGVHAVGGDPVNGGVSQGAAYVVQWYVAQTRTYPDPAFAPPRLDRSRKPARRRDRDQP